MNGTPKLVASTTLDRVKWQNSTLIAGDATEALTRLKGPPGKNIAITGSPTPVGALLRAGVLDELTLLVHPLVVGRGKRLFEAIGGAVPLTLMDSRTLGTGVVVLTYAPMGPQG